MRYVAQREFQAGDTNGKVVTYKVGDLVPHFTKWSVPAQRAILNMEYVKQVPDEVPVLPVPPPAQTKAEAKKPEPIKCGQCGKEGFKTSAALKTHMTVKHSR